jgi:hypothetical protein
MSNVSAIKEQDDNDVRFVLDQKKVGKLVRFKQKGQKQASQPVTQNDLITRHFVILTTIMIFRQRRRYKIRRMQIYVFYNHAV